MKTTFKKAMKRQAIQVPTRVARKAHESYAELRDAFLTAARDYIVIEDNIVMRGVFEDDVMLRTAANGKTAKSPNWVAEDQIMLRTRSDITIKDVVLPKVGYYIFEDDIILRSTNRGTTMILPVHARSEKQKEGEIPLAIIGQYPRGHREARGFTGLAVGYMHEGRIEKTRIVDAKGNTIKDDLLPLATFKNDEKGVTGTVEMRALTFEEFDLVMAMLERGMFDELNDWWDDWLYNNGG